MSNVNYNNKKLEIEKSLDSTKISSINLSYDHMKEIKPNINLEKSEANEKQIFEFMDKYFQLDSNDFIELYPQDNTQSSNIKEKIHDKLPNNLIFADEKRIYVEKNKRINHNKPTSENMDLEKNRNNIEIEETLYAEEIIHKEKQNEMIVDKDPKFKKNKKKHNIRKITDDEVI